MGHKEVKFPSVFPIVVVTSERTWYMAAEVRRCDLRMVVQRVKPVLTVDDMSLCCVGRCSA